MSVLVLGQPPPSSSSSISSISSSSSSSSSYLVHIYDTLLNKQDDPAVQEMELMILSLVLLLVLLEEYREH